MLDKLSPSVLLELYLSLALLSESFILGERVPVLALIRNSGTFRLLIRGGFGMGHPRDPGPGDENSEDPGDLLLITEVV